MAINPYQPDDQLPSADYNESVRNCPTPSLLDDLIGTFEGHVDGSIQEILEGYSSPDFATLGEMGTFESGVTGQIAAATATSATSTQLTAMASHNNVTLPNYVDMQPSTSYLNSNSFDCFLNETNSFTSEQLAPFPYEDDTKSFLDSANNFDTASETTMTSSRKAARKDKCMSKNAILARQNREKKKSEQHNLMQRVDKLEEENASLKKKNKELSDNNSNLVSRVRDLEAVIQNIPQIVNMVEHMQKFPGPSSTKASNSGANSNCTNKKT